jgi:predicted glycosyltransferase
MDSPRRNPPFNPSPPRQPGRRFVLCSHDGFGLGHVRRNGLIARQLLAEPDTEVVMVTGSSVGVPWFQHRRLSVVSVPSMTKDSAGMYRHSTMSFEEALRERARLLTDVVHSFRPTALVIDRHPYGIGGEWRPGIELARSLGARIVVGLRDILDDPAVVRSEMEGDGWSQVAELFDDAFVYGAPSICDHRLEYGLPIRPTYLGWVTDPAPVVRRDPNLVVVTAGGGADGESLLRLALATAGLREDRQFIIVAGPYADHLPRSVDRSGRVSVVRSVPGCAEVFATAGFVVQMAGYNSTFEALSAGIRPILLPRRAPRREQAIRATRLASLGLADVLDDASTPSELAWLLDRPRGFASSVLQEAGIHMGGASLSAAALLDNAREFVS